jgi:hypothetical protein
MADNNLNLKIKEILPKVLVAGENAGFLSKEGARLLDKSGELLAGIPFCPPEGDAGTGMVATNSVEKRTGNVSAGTSVFAMVVLEKELSKVYPELDLVTTPSGHLVAMVHSNNCTSDLNAWVGLFGEFVDLIGAKLETNELYKTLYNHALNGDKDCGNLLSYGYVSSEHITKIENGRPLFLRKPESKFNLANFMRVNLYTCLGALKIGMDILIKNEKVKIDKMYGHGGLFKTEKVGQSIMAAAINAPVTVMDTAGEGGAWGIALLASYMINSDENESLENYLSNKVFVGKIGVSLKPNVEDVLGFEKFMESYIKGLEIEKLSGKLFL